MQTGPVTYRKQTTCTQNQLFPKTTSKTSSSCYPKASSANSPASGHLMQSLCHTGSRTSINHRTHLSHLQNSTATHEQPVVTDATNDQRWGTGMSQGATRLRDMLGTGRTREPYLGSGQDSKHLQRHCSAKEPRGQAISQGHVQGQYQRTEVALQGLNQSPN